MIPELGHFALILTLCLALIQATVPLAGAFRGNLAWMAVGRSTAFGQFVFLLLAFGCLTYAFVTSDFSVAYVAENSNTRLPLIYRISAVWGAHEGSLLLWVTLLGAWSAAVAAFSRSLPPAMVARALAVMGMVSIGFLLFMLLTSNPFERLFPAPPEGRDLNPLLQDPGLAMHPPLLYMGYVGMSVAFSFALSAMIGGKLDAAWARWSRPWTTIAWVFLTLGITLGSWWSYNELGWGGWWFWDPVENASFMPWLAGTALIHSLAVTEKRGAFKNWTVLLALFAFSLSLLGTFLVRSGVLVSVHAFATDPSRGIFILVFLLIVVGSSLAVYAWRAPRIRGGGSFDLLSRESFLLGGNVLLVVIAVLVLLGTLAPLIYDALGWGKISVGFPWFNRMFSIFSPLLFVLLGLAPNSRWKHMDGGQLLRRIWIAGAAALITGLIFGLPFFHGASPLVGLGLALAVWITLANLATLLDRMKHKRSLGALLRQPASYYGMLLAHLGTAVAIVGVTLVSAYSVEKDLRMDPGDSTTLAGYRFEFEGAKPRPGPNYLAQHGIIRVYRGDRQVAVLEPEKRTYLSQTRPMTEAGIDVGFTRDLYASLGEPLSKGAWSMRLYYKPFVRWIWGGGVFIALGGLLAVADRRYRMAVARRTAAAGGGVLKTAGGKA